MKLAGKVAIITGAARGIGKACAERYLKEGAKVVVADIAAEALERTAAALGDASRIVDVGADVSKRADVDSLPGRVPPSRRNQRRPRPPGLLLSAGGRRPSAIASLRVD